MAQIERLIRIFGTTVPTFFCLEKPISRNMKPACMKSTKTAATMTQVDSTAGITSLSVVAASMTASVSSPRARVIRPAYRIQRGAFVRRYGGLAAAQPVIDEIPQLLRGIGLLDLLGGDRGE